MIQPRTMLDVADNSGAKKAQCIRVLGGSNKRYASLGDIVIVAVKEAVPDGTVKKGEVARAVVDLRAQPDVQARIDDLAARCNEGELSAVERARFGIGARDR